MAAGRPPQVVRSGGANGRMANGNISRMRKRWRNGLTVSGETEFNLSPAKPRLTRQIRCKPGPLGHSHHRTHSSTRGFKPGDGPGIGRASDRGRRQHRFLSPPSTLAHCLRSARIYFIFVSAAISSLPSAVLIASCTCSPLPPAGNVAEMRFPFFGSAFTPSLNNTVSPRFNVTRNGVAGSMLKN
jgi:hypothetical protein